MKNEANAGINGWQVMLLINGCQVGTGIFQIGRVSEKSHTAWVSVILAAAVPIFTLWLIHQALKKYPQKNLIELVHDIFGKPIGFWVLLLYIVSQLLIAVAVFRIQLELVCMNLLTRTPISVVALLTALTVFIIANKGIMAITRLNELMFYFTIALLCFFISPIFQEATLTNLLPLHEIDWSVRVRAILPISLLYSGTGVLFIWYPLLKEKEKMFGHAAAGVALTMSAYLYLLLGCLLVYGADMMEYMLLPVLSLLKIIPNHLIQRSDFFVLGLWIGIGMRPIINSLFAASECASHMSENAVEDHQKRFLWISAVFCLLLWMVVIIPENITQGFTHINTFLFLGNSINLIFPFLLWTGGVLHEKRQQAAVR